MQQNDPFFDSVKSGEADGKTKFIYLKKNGQAKEYEPKELRKAFE